MRTIALLFRPIYRAGLPAGATLRRELRFITSDEMLEQLTVRTPNHPLVAVFQPFIKKNRELLERNAAAYYTQIKTDASNERPKAKLLRVFIDWKFQRFSELEKEEIETSR